MQAAPMLSNPPALVLLALVVGLGAYLRQVAENAAKLLDEINEGRHSTIYPEGAERTTIKIRALENTREKLNGTVAPIMIWVSVFTAVRLVLQSLSDLPNVDPANFAWLDPVFRWVDFLVFVVILIVFFCLGRMHSKALDNDRMIRSLVPPKQAAVVPDQR